MNIDIIQAGPSGTSGTSGSNAGTSNNPGTSASTDGKRVEKHHSYTHKLKLEVILYAEKYSNRAAGRKYGIDEACVRRWRKKKGPIAEIVEKGGMGAKQSRIGKGGRKVASTHLDRLVLAWVKEKRRDSVRISTGMLQKKARELATSNLEVQEELERNIVGGPDEFFASRGWMVRFMRRNQLSFRRKTTQGQHRPITESYLIRNFILFVRAMRIKNRYLETDLIAMDETAVWLDSPGDTTITPIGARTIKVKTTKHEKNRVTVCLSARANGAKTDPGLFLRGSVLREILPMPIFRQSYACQRMGG